MPASIGQALSNSSSGLVSVMSVTTLPMNTGTRNVDQGDHEAGGKQAGEQAARLAREMPIERQQPGWRRGAARSGWSASASARRCGTSWVSNGFARRQRRRAWWFAIGIRPRAIELHRVETVAGAAQSQFGAGESHSTCRAGIGGQRRLAQAFRAEAILVCGLARRQPVGLRLAPAAGAEPAVEGGAAARADKATGRGRCGHGFPVGDCHIPEPNRG